MKTERKPIWWDEEMDPQFITTLLILLIGIVLVLLTGCASPKIIKETYYQERAADTAMVESIVNGQVQVWQSRMDSTIFRTVKEYTHNQEGREDERETITETVTSYVDSLGREVKEEQRTTERSLSRQWKTREAKMQADFRLMLRQAIEKYDSVQSEKYKEMEAHWSAKDSSSQEVIPEKKESAGSIIASIIWKLLLVLIVAVALWLGIGWKLRR